MTGTETATYPVWMIRKLYKAEDDLKAEVAALKKQIAELEQKQKLAQQS
jgi:cell division protein FtsB